jgi:hypothetical protein
MNIARNIANVLMAVSAVLLFVGVVQLALVVMAAGQ